MKIAKLVQASAPVNLALTACCLVFCVLIFSRFSDYRQANAALEMQLAQYGEAIDSLSAQLGLTFDGVNARFDGLDAFARQSEPEQTIEPERLPLSESPADAQHTEPAAKPDKVKPAAPVATEPSASSLPETEEIALPETPLASANQTATEPAAEAADTTAPEPSSTVAQGDVLTVRISAPTVSDMYGYQFRLEYDSADLAPAGGLKSLISEITTIFKKESDGCILVGATMTGDATGYSTSGGPVCEIKLTALSGGELPEIHVTKVGVVSSAMQYSENVGGWTCEVLTGGAQ